MRPAARLACRLAAFALSVGLAAASAMPADAQAPTAWEPTAGPVAGTVAHLDSGPDGVLYAVAEAQLFRSTDGGLAWTRAEWPEDAYDPVAFAAVADGSRGGALIAVGPTAIATAREGAHGYATSWRSTDGGETWSPLTFGSDGDPFVYALAEAADAVLAAGDRLQRSTDGGVTWAEVGPDTPFHALATVESSAIAASADSVYRSADGGATWSAAAAAPSWTRSLALASDGTAYALSLTPSHSDDSVARLVPGADAWEILATPADADVLALALDSNESVLLGTEAGAFFSGDAGRTWRPLGGVESGLPPEAAYAFEPVPDGDLLVGTAYGLWRGGTGGTFEQVGVIAADVTALAAGEGPDGRPLLAAGTWRHGVHLSRDGGRSWALALRGPFNVNDAAVGPEGDVWVAPFGVLQRSTDGGVTWDSLSVAGPLSAVTVGPDGTVYVAYTGTPGVARGVFESEDAGQTWDYIGFRERAVSDLAVGPDGAVYAVASDNGASSLYRWESGETWRALEPRMYSPTPGPNGLLLGSKGAAIYRSEDWGDSWKPVYEGGTGVWTIALRGLTAVALDRDGAAVASADGGRTWTPIEALSARSRSGRVSLALDGNRVAYAGTSGRGVYRTVGQPVSALPGPSRSGSPRLSVWPNPSPSGAAVSVGGLPTGTVTVAVYDALGRRVARLHDGPVGPSGRRFVLDAALPAGVYVVRAVAGGEARSVRVVVVR